MKITVVVFQTVRTFYPFYQDYSNLRSSLVLKTSPSDNDGPKTQ